MVTSLVCLALALLGPPAGDPPARDPPAREVTSEAQPSKADEARARAAFERGRAYYLEGRYDEALPFLRQAHALSGRRPSTIRALALCERALGSDEDALRLFRAYLDTRPPEAERIAVERAIDELEAHARAPTSTVAPLWENEPGTRETASPETKPTDPDLTASVPERAEETSLLRSPLFWAAAAVAVLGGTVLVVTLASRSDPPAPYGGSLDRVLWR